VDDSDLAGQVERAFGRYQFRNALESLRPRQQRARILSAPRVAVSGAVALAVLALAISASPLAVSPTLGFVGWRTAPDSPNPGFAAAANQKCSVGSSMRLVAQDQRGNAATLIYAGGGDLTLCLVAQDSTGTIVTAASGSTHLEAAGGPLVVDTGLSAPASSTSPGVRILVGRASAPITSVNVVRSDGVDVAATVSSGYWVAWWPSTVTGTSVRSTDSHGAVVQVATPLN